MKAIEFNWQILGQDKIKKYLKKSIAGQAFTHAYLFLGPEKIGKTKAAKLIAKSLLCENYQKYLGNFDKKVIVPCGQCTHCEQFEKNIHPDVYVLEREQKEDGQDLKTRISIKQVRDLQNRISKRAFLNSYKIVIVPQADFLTEEASNSLLKTLEEPTQKTVLFLMGRSRASFLETIISRCQTINFNVVGKKEIYDYLLESGANRDQAKMFSRVGCGRPTRAMKLFSNQDEFLAFKDNQIRFLEILNSNLHSRFLFADEESTEKKDNLTKKIDEWEILLRDLLFVQSGNEEQVSNIHIIENLKQLESKFSIKKIRQLILALEKSKIDINKNINIKLTLENFFLKI